MTKILIVGGVAGGASAAARARRIDEQAEIILFERGEFISFANCGLPYHISGTITARSGLLLQTPESFKKRFHVDVRTFNEVTDIDADKKIVTVRHCLTGECYTESYDKLLLSPGASPVKPQIPGINNNHVYSLRNIPDMDKILLALAAEKPAHATVVGGGFIGLEMVEALHHRGVAVTLLELSDQIMAPVDREMANLLHGHLCEKGVDLRLKTGLTAISTVDVYPDEPEATAVYDLPIPPTNTLELMLSSGDKLQTGMVIMAIGVKPETMLAARADLELGTLGGIKVNSTMQTSDPDIYAVGDVIETENFITGNASMVPLAGPANRQGRIAADNMLGRHEHYRRTQGTAICKLFDMAIASTGLNEKTLKKLNMPYEKIYVHTASHASYYPGAHPVTLKLIFDPEDGQILGAQAAGLDGIDKRIDVLAVAQRARMTVQMLADLELTYAPPFGSARDVINQAGMVASNVMNGDGAICHPEELLLGATDQIVLDVRNPAELKESGSIPGAINVPLDELRDRLYSLPVDKEILVACQVGLRGHIACRILLQHGFEARNLSGGYKTYQMVTHPF